MAAILPPMGGGMGYPMGSSSFSTLPPLASGGFPMPTASYVDPVLPLPPNGVQPLQWPTIDPPMPMGIPPPIYGGFASPMGPYAPPMLPASPMASYVPPMGPSPQASYVPEAPPYAQPLPNWGPFGQPMMPASPVPSYLAPVPGTNPFAPPVQPMNPFAAAQLAGPSLPPPPTSTNPFGPPPPPPISTNPFGPPPISTNPFGPMPSPLGSGPCASYVQPAPMHSASYVPPTGPPAFSASYSAPPFSQAMPTSYVSPYDYGASYVPPMSGSWPVVGYGASYVPPAALPPHSGSLAMPTTSFDFPGAYGYGPYGGNSSYAAAAPTMPVAGFGASYVPPPMALPAFSASFVPTTSAPMGSFSGFGGQWSSMPTSSYLSPLGSYPPALDYGHSSALGYGPSYPSMGGRTRDVTKEKLIAEGRYIESAGGLGPYSNGSLYPQSFSGRLPMPLGSGLAPPAKRYVEPVRSSQPLGSSLASPMRSYVEPMGSTGLLPSSFASPLNSYTAPVRSYVEPVRSFTSPSRSYLEPVRQSSLSIEASPRMSSYAVPSSRASLYAGSVSRLTSGAPSSMRYISDGPLLTATEKVSSMYPTALATSSQLPSVVDRGVPGSRTIRPLSEADLAPRYVPPSRTIDTRVPDREPSSSSALVYAPMQVTRPAVEVALEPVPLVSPAFDQKTIVHTPVPAATYSAVEVVTTSEPNTTVHPPVPAATYTASAIEVVPATTYTVAGADPYATIHPPVPATTYIESEMPVSTVADTSASIIAPVPEEVTVVEATTVTPAVTYVAPASTLQMKQAPQVRMRVTVPAGVQQVSDQSQGLVAADAGAAVQPARVRVAQAAAGSTTTVRKVTATATTVPAVVRADEQIFEAASPVVVQELGPRVQPASQVVVSSTSTKQKGLFDLIDKDHDGVITRSEMQEALVSVTVPVKMPEQIKLADAPSSPQVEPETLLPSVGEEIVPQPPKVIVTTAGPAEPVPASRPSAQASRKKPGAEPQSSPSLGSRAVASSQKSSSGAAKSTSPAKPRSPPPSSQRSSAKAAPTQPSSRGAPGKASSVSPTSASKAPSSSSPAPKPRPKSSQPAQPKSGPQKTATARGSSSAAAPATKPPASSSGIGGTRGSSSAAAPATKSSAPPSGVGSTRGSSSAAAPATKPGASSSSLTSSKAKARSRP